MNYPLCAHPDCYTCRALTASLLRGDLESHSGPRVVEPKKRNKNAQEARPDEKGASEGNDPFCCKGCGKSLPWLRRKKSPYCDAACKQKAYRRRNA